MTQYLQEKYKPYKPIHKVDRKWTNNWITSAPAWCSVDLRDGNQALCAPMSSETKTQFFQLLVNIGFKEIEVGYPSASKQEFQFIRKLIENNKIPNDVRIQVMTPARPDHIQTTMKSLVGACNPIVHLYNSTSEIQRRIVFRKSCREIIALAVDGVKQIKKFSALYKLPVQLLYTPESFSGTEPDFAVEICNAIISEWNPTTDNPIIINAAATVEMTTPNIFADQVEYLSNRLICRDAVILSIHTHNDRGTAVAAAEQALLAGGQRIEGTLFGNGERTGNMDIVTCALNLLSQGIDPKLNLSPIETIRDQIAQFTHIPIHPRHPYAGELVFTAFSGSHQDAIRKGLNHRKINNSTEWSIPYLPVDPSDLGRNCEELIKINSQSGKGGLSYILENGYGIKLNENAELDFYHTIQSIAENCGRALKNSEIYQAFCTKYPDQIRVN